MRIMITGAAGFIGTYLANYSSGLGATVLGIGITEPGEDWGGAAFEHCDVRDYPRLKQLLATFKPERIFHLAAQSYPTRSLRDPQETFTVNVGGTINLFEGLRALVCKPLVVVACSSAEYGTVAPSDLPVREDHLLQPLHPYGVSKVAQDLLAAQYFFNYSIPTLRIRIFNTTGPGKIEDLCSDLTRRAAEIELGLRPPKMPAGNLSTSRAIVDVRDLVRGLWVASEHCVEGEAYNLGGNSIYSVQEVIDAIRAEVNIPFSVEHDPALLRKCDEPVIAGDITKIRNCSGWAPEIELSRTLREMLHWWRSRLSAKSNSSLSRESRTHDLLV